MNLDQYETLSDRCWSLLIIITNENTCIVSLIVHVRGIRPFRYASKDNIVKHLSQLLFVFSTWHCLMVLHNNRPTPLPIVHPDESKQKIKHYCVAYAHIGIENQMKSLNSKRIADEWHHNNTTPFHNRWSPINKSDSV